MESAQLIENSILPAGQVEEYKQRGYVILRNFFDPAVLETIYRETRELFGHQIRRVLGREVDVDNESEFERAMYEFFRADFDAFVSTGKFVQHATSLWQLGIDEKLTDVLRELGLEHPVTATRPAMMFNSRHLSKDGGYWKLDAHQDWRGGQGSLDSVVIWFPFTPCDASLGCLQMVPGSHKNGLLASEDVGYIGKLLNEPGDAEYYQSELNVGDIIIFSQFTIHRSGLNSTENIRWTGQFRFNNALEPTYIERGYPSPYIYKPVPQLLFPSFPSQEQIDATFA